MYPIVPQPKYQMPKYANILVQKKYEELTISKQIERRMIYVTNN